MGHLHRDETTQLVIKIIQEHYNNMKLNNTKLNAIYHRWPSSPQQAIFECTDCGKHWENYLTARNNARKHARKYQHTVTGEVAYAVIYHGKGS